MKRSGFALFCLVLILVAAGITFDQAFHREDSIVGFRDFVKNPQKWIGASQAFADLEAMVAAAKEWDDDQVAASTNSYILDVTSSREAGVQRRILRELGDRTHSTVLPLLQDPSLYSRLVKLTEDGYSKESPFERACDLLGDAPPVESVEVLAPFLEDRSSEIRKEAALAIAKTGAATITPLMKKAFLDEDPYVCSYALMGMEFALSRSSLAEGPREALFPELVHLIRINRDTDDALKILVRLDRPKATKYLLSSEMFNAESPILKSVLNALAEAKVPVPREQLKSIIASLDGKESTTSKTDAFGKALRLLGQQRNEEDREFLKGYMTHADKYLSEDAAEALLCSYGLDDFRRRIWEIEKQYGYESLNETQKLYRAVFLFDAEVNNGGFDQYFFNSFGNQWDVALDGLHAMGFNERLKILFQALKKFGADGPSTIRSIRQNELSVLSQGEKSVFRELDQRYYDCHEVLEVFVAKFVIEHADQFR